MNRILLYIMMLFTFITNTFAQRNKEFEVGDISFTMIFINGGTFEEATGREVTLSSYFIGETEVSIALWNEVMGESGSTQIAVSAISYNDCQQFIEKLNQITHKNFRLPTEAEWEYAATGGNTSYEVYNGNILKMSSGNGYIRNDMPQFVTNGLCNGLGIYNMIGNVWEWCQDWYGPLSKGQYEDPQGPTSGTDKVIKGGGWWHNLAYGNYPSWRWRGSLEPDAQYSDVGLRLAMSYEKKKKKKK